MDQEATDSESVDICGMNDEEGEREVSRCFEVLRTLVKGVEVAWVVSGWLSRICPDWEPTTVIRRGGRPQIRLQNGRIRITAHLDVKPAWGGGCLE